jgi:hypothetical protein
MAAHGVGALRDRWERARTSEDFAWACLFANVVGVPGLGTWMARRREAAPQIALSIVGGVLLTWWLVGFVLAALRTMTFPPPGAPSLGLGLWGLALFGVGWVWALASSLAQLRSLPRSAPGSRNR